MIEVLFGESDAGLMKAAKSWDVNSPLNTDGTVQDVICLAFALDIGDIQQKPNSDYRNDLLFSLYAQNAWGPEPDDEELRELASIYAGELNRLEHHAQNGEPMRIWYSNTPYSLCGLCHVLHRLRKINSDIYLVRLPELPDENGVIYAGWGEISPENIKNFLPEQVPLTPQLRQHWEQTWRQLREQNSPLRAVISGKLTSVPEDFYDFLLWRHLGDKPVTEARVIGEILGQYPLGIGDCWYARRIQHFIEAGAIRVVQDSEQRYARILRREG